jgi:hypothetical protein
VAVKQTAGEESLSILYCSQYLVEGYLVVGGKAMQHKMR